MELIEKIVNTEVVDKLGNSWKVESFILRETVEDSLIQLSNGKKYSVGITYKNRLLQYEDDIERLIDEELEKESEKKREEPLPVVNVVRPPVTKPNTNVLYFIGNDAIDSFREEYYFLSNMYSCPITYNGLTYQSSESAFQAQKDLARSVEFTTISGRSAKSLGKRVNLRSDWESVKVGIMEEIVREKFTQNEDLKAQLLLTGDKELVEGNTWNDRFWGVCKGKGLNKLGKILMKIREELKNQ